MPCTLDELVSLTTRYPQRTALVVAGVAGLWWWRQQRASIRRNNQI